MNVNMINGQNFGIAQRQEGAKKGNKVKRSLIDGRILRQDEVLDDVYEYCRRQKTTAAKRKSNLPRCIFTPGDLNEARTYKEWALLNVMEKLNRLHNDYIVNDYAAKR